MRRSVVVVALAAALCGAAPSPIVPSQTPALQPARAHWPVQGADEETQRLIDRGVMMLYAFDIGEARVAFEKALLRNNDLALAYWGEAEADTIDINQPQTDAGDRRGETAVEEGRRHLAHASVTERMLVDAIAKRYGRGSKRERFVHYADALSAWTKMHRDDPNVLAVAAYAIWNAEDSVLNGEEPTAKAKEMLADLDDALKIEPTHLGAHHLRIHLLEELQRSREAIHDAEALDSYAYPPGTSHLPHMPGHIWSRLGEYAKLVDDNERAVANDRAWFAEGEGPGQRYMQSYHNHDVDFVLYGLTTLGRNEEARSFAQREDSMAQLKAALRMHDDLRVDELAGTRGGAFAAGALVAAARRGDAAAAKAARGRISGSSAISKAMSEAMISLAGHDTAGYVAGYARAYDLTKNDSPGDPKSGWETPIGEGYGAALLAANRPADAEKVFAAELKRFPNDPHLEFGLAEALRAQGKDDSIPRAAYHAHWKGIRDLTVSALG